MVAFKGHADCALIDDVPHIVVRMGAIGKYLKAMHDEGVEELVMAGPVHRPSFTDLRPDLKGAKLLAKTGALALGDDGLLSAAIKELENEGFKVVGMNEVLEDLVATAGPYGTRTPNEQDLADIKRGFDVAKGLGALDVGQAVIVQQSIVLAVEAVEGTEAMIGRCGALRRDGGGGVLVKACKPEQERRADLPTIGVATVEQAAAAGLTGVAVEAGRSMVVDGEAVGKKADELGLFVIGMDA